MKLTPVFIFSIFLSLIACSPNKEFEQNLIMSMQSTTLTLDQQIKHDLRASKSLLADEAKSKYSEIIPALDSVSYYFTDLKLAIKMLEKEIDENTNPKINVKESIAILDGKLKNTKLKASMIYENLLNNHGKTYGLRDEEIKHLIKKRKSGIDSLASLSTYSPSDLNYNEFRLHLAQFEMDVTRSYLKNT